MAKGIMSSLRYKTKVHKWRCPIEEPMGYLRFCLTWSFKLDWGSETYEEKAEFTEEESKEEAVKEEGSGFDSTGAALGAAAALAAATLLLGRKGERNPEKAGVYIAATDRERILSSINSLTKKRYEIDSEGYLREDETAPPREVMRRISDTPLPMSLPMHIEEYMSIEKRIQTEE